LNKRWNSRPNSAALLDRSCVSDPSLRQEVEVLLAASDDVRSSFLQSSITHGITLTPGTKVGEHEVKSLLGTGGMGEVYRARDSRLGRDVAIKVLPAFPCTDSERLRRFEQEARAAAALNHPNILAVFQMGTYEGAPYLVSELLEGEALREKSSEDVCQCVRRLIMECRSRRDWRRRPAFSSHLFSEVIPACFGTLRLRYCGPGANNLRLKI
jgi:hypothetical protein